VVETFRPHNWDTPNLRAIERLLAGHGFLPYRYDPVARELSALAGPADGDQNTIYVRDPVAVAARVRAAPPATLAGRPICTWGNRVS